MQRQFAIFTSAIATDQTQPIARLNLLSPEERYQLLVEWNNTQTDYPQDKCIHQLFEEQVERTPDAVAVVFESEKITYWELNERANQLARYLQSLGVGPEVLVGICVERSIEMVMGLLGILKAGGAYIPLDPSYPRDRIAYMIQDAELSIVVTQKFLVAGQLNFATQATQKQNLSLVCLDSDWESIVQNNRANPQSEINPKNLAYIIYTSGSTGKPKGVQIAHTSVVNLLHSIATYPGFSDGDSLIAITTISFDISVLEIYLSLITGARCILVSREVGRDAKELMKLIDEFNPTVMQATPSTWRMLLESAWQGSSQLKILCGGESLSRDLADRLLEKCASVWNLYGPTEITVWATLSQVKSGESQIAIGRPIANTQIYILDRNLEPVPIGQSGELHVGGVGLARGYLNRPKLTAEKFIPNPFSTQPNSRLYKTGDLACYLPDGNIKYLERIDNQLKIRGFRIEVGEIEATLSQHPMVKQAAITARKDTSEKKRLVAYIVPYSSTDNLRHGSANANQPYSQPIRQLIRQLRRFLQDKLPDYMMPSAFVVLDEMPLTPNGKIDRHALPAPDQAPPLLELELVAPRTPTEAKLAAIWAEVLGCQQVSINDNFFELGGNSLLATQIISRIQQAFSIEVSLHQLIEAPTIAFLSKIVETVGKIELQEQSSRVTGSDSLPLILLTTGDKNIPLSFAQEYIWYVQQLNPDSCVCNTNINLRFAGKLSSEVLEGSINEIIRCHEIMRTTFSVVDGQPVQAIAPELTLSLKIVNLQDLPTTAEREAEALKVSEQEMKHHFHLASGPLIKATLLQLSPEEHWLLILMHHMITDGRSIGIFLQELETLYNAFSNGLPSPLAEVRLQYADFTLWQRQQFNEERLKKQLDYWIQKLVAPVQQLESLPAKQPKPNLNSSRASSYSLVLKENLVASLKNLSISQKVTISVIIIAALKLLLFKWSGNREILVVTTIGNRSTPEIEKMLGCFINDVILRSELDDKQTGLELLERVQETLGEAICNKEIPLQKVIEVVKSKRELTLSASVTIGTPVNNFDRMPEWEFAPKPARDELWEKEIPLETYISTPSRDSKTIKIKAIYSTDLFASETIENLFGYYQEILKKLAELPEIKLAAFEGFPEKK